MSDELILRKYGKIISYRNYRMEDGRIEKFLCLTGTTVSVIGMAITEDENILLIRQFRYAIGEFVWEFPGGNPKPGQSPEDGFRMELDEEVGYEPNKIQLVGEPIPYEPCSVNAKYQVVLATGCRYRHPPRLDQNEIMQTVEMPLDEFLVKARNRQLAIDSKTAAITFLTLPLLGR